MKKIQLGKEFFIAAFLALICSVLCLFIIDQEDAVDAACIAIESNNYDEMINMADKVLDLNQVGRRNETMLMVACKNGNVQAIDYLISRNVDVNYCVDGAPTPLELFCRSGYNAGEEALLSLLNSGARQSIYTHKPAVFYLAEEYYWMTDEQKAMATEQTILMLKAGAPMGHGTTSLLHLAAKGNMADLFYTLVHTNQGLSMISMEDGDGNTPWDVAGKFGAVDVQKVIRNLEQEYQEEQDKNKPVEPTPVDPTVPEGDNIDTEDYIEETFNLDAWLANIESN